MIGCIKWGEYGGKEVFLFTLKNAKGMKVKLTNFGCAVVGIEYKGLDVALGFDSLDAYVNQSCYIGVVVGRCANRIKDGRFELNGTEYNVSKNLGNNQLHGGFKGFDKVLWDVETGETADGTSVCFSYLSKDGEEGYPGNLITKVTYSLDEDCGLKIGYEAVTDKPTVVNLANHAYFNLSGHDSGSVEDQWVRIDSDQFLENDEEGVPTGKYLPVAGTPFDFREFHKIGERIGRDDIQLKYGGGYDHNWVLKQTENGGMRLIAEAKGDRTNILMQVYTTMPGVQFYSGNSLAETIRGKNGAIYVKRCGFCLETQFWPDAINHPDFPQPVLNPGQVFKHETTYRFEEK
jgi:aldose 1-epimerase